MSAIVQCGDVVTDPISVRNGLRQGCTMAPVLFNTFMWAVVQGCTMAPVLFDIFMWAVVARMHHGACSL